MKRYVVQSKDGVSLPHRESVDLGAIPAPSYITNAKQRAGRTSGKCGPVISTTTDPTTGQVRVRELTRKGKPIATASEREDARRNAKYERDMRKLRRTQATGTVEHAGRGW
jgi:hypothetical protein